MSRTARAAPAGYVDHVLNRAVARLPLFQKEGDYEAFERCLAEALAKHPTRLLAYCLMPNHWHLVVWPSEEGELSAFVRWLAHTPSMRWHTHYHTLGTGHLYQGRFKSFPIQEDDHYYRVLRYVERNALRANLVARAEDWRWCSLYRRCFPEARPQIELAQGPLPLPATWTGEVNRPQTERELEALRQAVRRCCPFGNLIWQQTTAEQFHLEHTMRPRGRPRKRPKQ